MGSGMSKIVTGLYLGNIRDSEDHENLLRKGVTHILSVHNRAKPVLEDMTYLCISASDSSSENLLQHFKECIQFIHECRLGGGGCLVHCFSGHPDNLFWIFLAVPCMDPPGLWQEPLPGPGGAAEPAGPAAAGEQGLLLAQLPSSHLPSSLPRRWHRWWQQMDEQISSQAVPRQALGLGKLRFPFAKHLQGFMSRAEICQHQGWGGGDRTHRPPCQLPAPVNG
ncbi:PREDICTED: dual specificity protein phosphatase 22-A-like isoform X3 [Ficedula albicollis]|uniref:dual specificity protein phosphatase 22-A-like isoform X3 n=1 Tax=Ficedula albicollis TaxID=59894 RepID=UPI0003594E7B|nr:PREDICTED: dual specificity protein phosphatase 22-A-like isoform X3 [Ficedula albicollis]